MAKAHLKVRSGLTLRGTTSDPIDAEEGDLIFRSNLTPPRYREYRGGQWADIHDSRFIKLVRTADAATIGTGTTLAAFSTPFISVTNASLVSVSMIPAGEDGQVITLVNNTGVLVSLNDEVGATAANRIRTGTNKPVKMKDNVALTLIYDGTDSRWHVVGGPGGDTGDANAFTLEMQQRLAFSTFEWLTPYSFPLSEDALVDVGSTGTFNIADGSFDLENTETLITEQLLGVGFLSDDDLIGRVEVVVDWLNGKRDDAAVYDLSLNGGTDWQTVTMARVGLSDRYRGLLESLEPTTNATLQEYAVSNADIIETIGGSTPARAMHFTVTDKQKVKQLSVYIEKAGAPLGNFFVQIVREDTGVPSLDSSDIVFDSGPRSVAALSAGNNTVTLDLGRTLPAGTYWIIIKGDAAYNASVGVGVQIRWRGKISGPTNSATFNGTVWTGGYTTTLCYLVQGFEYDLRLRATASANTKAIEAFAVFFVESIGSVVSGDDATQVVEVNGDADTTEFTLTQFLPDPNRLKIYDTYSHLVYRYPTFELDGHTVKFLAGSFLVPGEKFQLIFDQSEGGGFDNSDRNAALLAANGLGSTDPDIDKSAAGVGIKLRSINGQLWQLKVNNDGSLTTEAL